MLSYVITSPFAEGLQQRLSFSFPSHQTRNTCVNLMCDETYDETFIGSPYNVLPQKAVVPPKRVRFAEVVDIAPTIVHPKTGEGAILEPVKDFWSFHQELEELETIRRVNAWLDE